MRNSNFSPGIAAALFLVLLLLSSVGLHAQFTSSLEGTVTDPTGAVLPGATVTVRNLATGEVRSLETSASGYYRVTSLPSSEFNVIVAAPGFQTTIQASIRIQVAETKTLNVELVLGSETVQITVTGEAPALEKSEARISGLFEARKVADLPLVGRNYISLVAQGGMHFTPGYPISCGWLIRRPRTCCTISE